MHCLCFHYRCISFEESRETGAAQAAWRQQIANLGRKVEELLDELSTIKAELLRFRALRDGNRTVTHRDLYRFLYPELWRDNATGNGCSIQLLCLDG